MQDHIKYFVHPNFHADVAQFNKKDPQGLNQATSNKKEHPQQNDHLSTQT